MSNMHADRERRIQAAIANATDEAQRIDIVAEQQGYFRPNHDSTFYPVVQDYLNNKLDLKHATNKLVSPIDQGILANRKYLDFIDLWYSIIHSAKRIPFRNTEGHTKLVELMKAIKSHPPPRTALHQDIYTCLRDFGISACETMNDYPGGSVGGGYLEPEVHAYTNMAYFYARLTKEKVRNLWGYAGVDMSNGLEFRENDDGPSTAVQEYIVQGQKYTIQEYTTHKYNARVPAAAVWVFALGKELYEKGLTPKKRNQGNPARGGNLRKRKQDFSKERWALWKSKFEEIANMDEVSEETRNIAKDAVEAMIESERA